VFSAALPERNRRCPVGGRCPWKKVIDDRRSPTGRLIGLEEMLAAIISGWKRIRSIDQLMKRCLLLLGTGCTCSE
jgi:hypothetical protein